MNEIWIDPFLIFHEESTKEGEKVSPLMKVSLKDAFGQS